MEDDSLSDQQSAYVEEIGLLYERNGVQRTVGKVMGLLLIAGDPLSQEDMMRLLNISRTSASAAVRWMENLYVIERVPVAGDRKRYYRLQVRGVDLLKRFTYHRVEVSTRIIKRAKEVAEPGALPRLEEMEEFNALIIEHLQAAMEEWLERRAAKNRGG